MLLLPERTDLNTCKKGGSGVAGGEALEANGCSPWNVLPGQPVRVTPCFTGVIPSLGILLVRLWFTAHNEIQVKCAGFALFM